MPPICPPDKILNPATNKCVLRTGAIGRRLIECPNGQIRNPVTGRCVNRDGAVGRRILRQAQAGQNNNNGAQPANRPAAQPANRPRIPSPPIVVNRMSKPELLAIIRELCYNTEDPISFDTWEDMTVTQLRTIVRVLDNGGVDFFTQRTEPLRPGEQHQRYHCFLLQNIKRWLQTWKRQFGDRRPPKHPVTNVPLTPNQVNIILGLRSTGPPRRRS